MKKIPLLLALIPFSIGASVKPIGSQLYPLDADDTLRLSSAALNFEIVSLIKTINVDDNFSLDASVTRVEIFGPRDVDDTLAVGADLHVFRIFGPLQVGDSFDLGASPQWSIKTAIITEQGENFNISSSALSFTITTP